MLVKKVTTTDKIRRSLREESIEIISRYYFLGILYRIDKEIIICNQQFREVSS